MMDAASGAYRVGGDVNVLLLAVLDQVVALQDGVALNLVGSGDDTSAVDDGLELSRGQHGFPISMSMMRGFTNVLNGVVGDTDGADLALGELGHGCNGFQVNF